MKIRKMLAILLTVCMVLTMTPLMAFAGTTTGVTDTRVGLEFPDVTGHWASEAIYKWAGLGVVNGDDRGFRPNDSITRAEMAVILNNLMDYQKKAENLFTDVNNSAWYADAVLKANSAGVFNGDGAGHATPTANITREQAAVMLARAFGVDESASNNTSFNDAGNISSWAQSLVFGMEADKYVGGMGNGNFEPKTKVTRAQVVTMIDNAVKAYYTTAGIYTENIAPEVTGANCVTIVRTDGVTIKGAKLSGDLIVAEGVAQGNFTLDGATIAGKLIARGGGTNSIHIINRSEVNGRVTVEKVDGALRIVSEGVAIANLDAKTKVVLEGDFTNVVVAEGAAVEVKGQVKNISVEGKAEVTIAKDAKVESLTVQKAAEGAKVTVSGTVTNLKTEAPKTEIVATETAKITTVEATSTAAGTDVSIDKKADIKTLESAAAVTTSGEGSAKAVTGTVTDKETGKVETTTPIASIGGGGGGGGGGGIAAPSLTSATIDGALRVNTNLTASTVLSGAGGTVSYHWYRSTTDGAVNVASDTAIGTNNATYKLTEADETNYVYCVVSAIGSTTGGSKNTNILGPIAAAKTIATLQSLSASYNDSGSAIDIQIDGFIPATTSYAVTIYEPYINSDQFITLSGIVTSGSDATITEKGVNLVSDSGTAVVVVMAEDGVTTNQYEVSFNVERRSIRVSGVGEMTSIQGSANDSGTALYLKATDSVGSSCNALGLGTLTVKNGGDTLTSSGIYAVGDQYDVNENLDRVTITKAYLDTLSAGKYTLEIIITTTPDGVVMTSYQEIYIVPTTATINYNQPVGGILEVFECTWDSEHVSSTQGALTISGGSVTVGGLNEIMISTSAISADKRIKSILITEEYSGYSQDYDLSEDFINSNGVLYWLPHGTATINVELEDVPSVIPTISGIELYKSYDFNTGTFSDLISSTTTGITVDDTVFVKVLFEGEETSAYTKNILETLNGFFWSYPGYEFPLPYVGEDLTGQIVTLVVSGVDKYSTGQASVAFKVNPTL